MRKYLILLASLFPLCSCGTTSTLYYWGGTQNGTTAYENLAYMSSDKQTPASICKLVCMYENMVSNPGGTRKVTPPGICAEYGYLLLQPETATTFINNATNTQKKSFATQDYTKYFYERGKEMMEMEMKLYPESVKFIEPLIKKLSK